MLPIASLLGACDRAPSSTAPERAADSPSIRLEAPPPAASTSQPAPGGSATAAHASAAASASSTPTPEPPSGGRIYAKARFVWIHPSPAAGRSWIGYLTVGGSAPLRGGSVDTAKVGGGAGRGCTTWYAVEPRGFVCAGDNATVDASDPVYRALAEDRADVTSPWPYHYGESIGAARYTAIPSPEKQRSTEWDLEKHLEHVKRAREASGDAAIAAIDKALVGVELGPTGTPAPELVEVGPFIREARAFVAPGSTIAYSRAFDSGDRAFVLTSDHAVVPRDRLRPYPRSSFHGVELGDDVALPIAFARKKARPTYRREGDSMIATPDALPRLGFLALSGEKTTLEGKTFLATKTPGLYVREDEVTVASRAAKTPLHGPPGDTPRTWVDIDVRGGTLVAYEEDRPVFATLISPGRGGVPVPGVDPLKTASTPTGTFRVDGKFRTATMVSSTDDDIVHAEVQYVQNFHGPHALHGAYWHDAWGEPKSGGCVNLSPIDSKRMFDWTYPRVPEGWHGLRAIKDFGPSTIVVVR
jgi:hypothetical protein